MRLKKQQNTEQKAFFISTKKHYGKGSKSMMTKISINDFFEEQSNPMSPLVSNKNIRINTRKATQKQEFINNLSLNKLRNITFKHQKLFMEDRSSPVSNIKQKRKTYGHIEQFYKQLQRNSFNTSVKEEIFKMKRRNLNKRITLPEQQNKQQKQSFKKQSKSLAVRNAKQSLFLKTAPSFEYDNNSNNQQENGFKDWSVYILRKKKITLEAKPLKLHQSDIKINTTFKFSLRSKMKPDLLERRHDQVCGWNSEKNEDF